jgi:hypothetical protein
MVPSPRYDRVSRQSSFTRIRSVPAFPWRFKGGGYYGYKLHALV